MVDKFIVKDSGQRQEYASGMHRDLQEGKPRFDLIIPKDQAYEESMLYRLGTLLAKAIPKYGERNWEKANSVEEYDRFKSSALRHMMQYQSGELDEDHASAVLFNIIAAEYVKGKLEKIVDGKK